MYDQGNIVLVPFPFTDLSSEKVRPALIISKKPLGNDVVLCFFTSKKPNTKNFVLVVQSKSNGLKQNSFLLPQKIATLEKKMILGKIGGIERQDMSRVLEKFKEIFLG